MRRSHWHRLCCLPLGSNLSALSMAVHGNDDSHGQSVALEEMAKVQVGAFVGQWCRPWVGARTTAVHRSTSHHRARTVPWPGRTSRPDPSLHVVNAQHGRDRNGWASAPVVDSRRMRADELNQFIPAHCQVYFVEEHAPTKALGWRTLAAAFNQLLRLVPKSNGAATSRACAGCPARR